MLSKRKGIKKLSQEQRELACQLVLEPTNTFQKIATEFNVSPQNIYNLAKKRGLIEKRNELIQQQLNEENLGES